MGTVEALVKQFEAGTLPKKDWTHAAHLTVALWYVTRHTPQESLTRMRNGIHFLNSFHGVESTPTSGYHETLTVFWLATVRNFAGPARSATLDELAAALIEAYGTRQSLWRDYYSFDVVKSVEARRSWVAPDLRSLEASVR